MARAEYVDTFRRTIGKMIDLCLGCTTSCSEGKLQIPREVYYIRYLLLGLFVCLFFMYVPNFYCMNFKFVAW